MTRDENGSLLKNAYLFFDNLRLLSVITAPLEPGTYELDCAKFYIRDKVNIGQSNIVVANPPFDHNLLTIE